jgi:cob(I)alamin adenosyltransferase
MPIYTKFGDRGETRLFDGTRVRKDDLRVRAYGEVDELNSVLGLVRTFGPPPEIHDIVVGIQKHLMGIGAVLANPRGGQDDPKARPQPEWVGFLEASIDRLDSGLPPLRRFILPGGGPAGAHLHLARTVCRRAERLVVVLAGSAEVEAIVLEYINRLSDLLFVLARAANYREGMEEVLW